MRSHKLGKDGEAFALEFLAREGYEIIEANYRCKTGEIDLVAQDHGVVCFIEVKSRQEDGWDAFEAVDRRKQRKIRQVALYYLLDKFHTEDVVARFDVLGVRLTREGAFEAELLKDAFGI